MTFFDSLVHVTDDGRWPCDPRYDASLARLLREMDAARVGRACLVGIAGYAPNETVARVASLHRDRFVPIAGFDPSSVDSERAAGAAVAQLSSAGFAGIKFHPRLNRYQPLDPRCLAAVDAAGDHGRAVFLCTLSQQLDQHVPSIVEIVDRLATRPSRASIVLLHGGGTAILDLFELVRMHAQLLLDLSFTIVRYAGSSLDLDLRFLIENLDQRIVLGSDFPQYGPERALSRFAALAPDLDPEKRANILHRNLDQLFESWFEGWSR